MKVGYAMAEAIRSIRRVPLMAVVSVGTIGLSLMVFGLFLLVTYNVQGVVQELRAKVDVEAFLEEDITGETLTGLRSEVATLSGVLEIHYVSKEQAKARFAADFGDSLLSLLEGLAAWLDTFGPAVTHAHLQMRGEGRSLVRFDRFPDRAAEAVGILGEAGYAGSFALEFTEGTGADDENIDDLFANALRDLAFLKELLA